MYLVTTHDVDAVPDRPCALRCRDYPKALVRYFTDGFLLRTVGNDEPVSGDATLPHDVYDVGVTVRWVNVYQARLVDVLVHPYLAMRKAYLLQGGRVVGVAKIQAEQGLNLTLLCRRQLVNDVPILKHQARHPSRQSSGVNGKKVWVFNALNLGVLGLGKEAVSSVVADYELAVRPTDELVVHPKASRGVVVHPYLSTGADGQLPKDLPCQAVGLVDEQVVTLSVLRILCVLVRLELYKAAVQSTVEALRVVACEEGA